MKANIITFSLLSLLFITQMAISNDFKKLLPQEIQPKISKSDNFIPNLWKDFSSENGNWYLEFENNTGFPSAAIGKPIKIGGYNYIDENNIQEAVNHFLEVNNKFFKINPNNISKRKLVKVKNTWAISYVQIYNGLEVLMTKIEFKVRDDGNIISFNIKYFNDLQISTEKLISTGQAKASAVQGMNVKSSSNSLETDSKSFILPLVDANKASFAIVYKYIVTDYTDNQPTKWSSYVDANTGDLLWRKPLCIDAINTIEGNVKKTHPEDEETPVPLSDCYVNLNNTTYTTDVNGQFVSELSEGQTCSFGFSGPWCNVDIFKYTKVPNTELNDTITKDNLNGLNIIMKADNSTLDERYLFYYTNVAHDFYKTTDPDSKAMDYQCNIYTTYSGSPNAASDLQTGNIVFYNTNNSIARLVETPSVLYHEYGHSANQRLYQEVGITQGMINLACHEALADVNSALILNESKIGLGGWINNPTKFIRDINNQNQYPKDVNDDDHLTGMILSGAYWDLVKELSIDTVRYLTHFTEKLGTPDDENIGIAFGEWFMETLITDDVLYGDADLSNGTPHFKQIITAFNNHKIGTSLALENSFSHTQHEDTDDITNDYEINFHLGTSVSFINSKPVNVKVIYYINKIKNPLTADAVEISDSQWQAKIPAQPRGTTIFYYMEATDQITETVLDFFPKDYDNLFSFSIGYHPALFLDFNNDNERWTSGNPSDNTSTGVWEWGIPKPYYNFYKTLGLNYPLQSSGDHRSDGEISGKCWATGLDNGGDSTVLDWDFIPQGRTTLETKNYDISNLNNPIIDYWRWFTNIPYQKSAFWVIKLSNDGGLTWIKADSSANSMDKVWEEQRIYLNNYFNDFSFLKLQFIFYGLTSRQGRSEGAIDDFSILSGNDELVSSVSEINPINISSYPNPVNSELTLNYFSTKYGTAKIELYNVLGDKLADFYDGYINQGVYNQKFDLSNYSTGLYFIRINHNHETSNILIIKK